MPVPQGNSSRGGISGPASAAPGSTVTIHLGPNDTVVEVKEAWNGTPQPVPVRPGKSATFTVPNLPGGSIVSVLVGDGRRRRVLFLEVVAPGP